MAESPTDLHFLMFPITAQGHIVPMVDIARILSQRGATVTIITTPLVSERFRPVILRAIQAKLKIQLLELKLPLAEVGLPEGSENYDTISHSEVLYKLMFATDLIEEPAEDMLRGLCPPPDCIISDFLLKILNQHVKIKPNIHPLNLDAFHGLGSCDHEHGLDHILLALPPLRTSLLQVSTFSKFLIKSLANFKVFKTVLISAIFTGRDLSILFLCLSILAYRLRLFLACYLIQTRNFLLAIIVLPATCYRLCDNLLACLLANLLLLSFLVLLTVIYFFLSCSSCCDFLLSFLLRYLAILLHSFTLLLANFTVLKQSLLLHSCLLSFSSARAFALCASGSLAASLFSFSCPPIIGSSKEDFTDKKGFMFRAIEVENAAHGIIVHTFEELEPEYVKELSNSKAKKVWCIGPVSLSNKDNLDIAERGNNKAAIDKHDCLKWLDEREPGNKSKELQKWFVEEGYEERVKDRDLVVHGWAPQVLILSHQAIGGFLTHCGWNSLLETISAGIPVVTWPFFADQFLNETFMVEILKIGVRIGVEIPVPFGDEDKHGVLVQKEDIKTAVECLMDKEDEEGKQRRKRAGELAEMAKTAMAEGGSSYINVSSLIQDIETFKAQHKSVSLLSL
ncbi:UDP-glycosyltransferase 73E1-like protein [Tanacetum coccineum]